jgi:hypothetical protein
VRERRTGSGVGSGDGVGSGGGDSFVICQCAGQDCAKFTNLHLLPEVAYGQLLQLEVHLELPKLA